MTLTIENMPEDLERALRERAAAEDKSVDATVIDVLAAALGIKQPKPTETVKYRDLSDIAGSGGIDDEMEAFFWEHRRIDPEIWQ